MRKGAVTVRSRGDRQGGAKGRIASTAPRRPSPRFLRNRTQPPLGRIEGDYVAVVAHELRTPLTALRIHLDTALREANGSSNPHGSLLPRLESARHQVERLVMLVDQLLDASRIAKDAFELDLEEVDLMEVVRDVLSRMREQLMRSRCEIEVIAPASVVGTWNRLALEQVVTNLVVNAAKFGCGKPIELIVAADEEQVCLRVVDHGIGIARTDQARIFERYEQVKGSRRHGGLGLGLWIVSRLLSALGGRIHVESRLGQGATFVVELARKRPREV